MENTIKSQPYNLTFSVDSDYHLHNPKTGSETFSEINLGKDEFIKINDSKYVTATLSEDSSSVLNGLYSKREVILNEKWEITENIQAKVIHVSNSQVNLDCLIDIEKKLFQNRTFPIHLFSNITGLGNGKFVIIKTSFKSGSLRIDTYPGDGIVYEKLFIQHNNWSSFKKEDLGDKLTEW